MPFADPVVAGTELIREAIQSPDYASGSAGWRIGADGTAEFNDATMRGSVSAAGGSITLDDNGVTVSDVDGSRVRMYDEPSGSGAILSVKPADLTSGETIAPGMVGGLIAYGSSSESPAVVLAAPRNASIGSPPVILLVGQSTTATSPWLFFQASSTAFVDLTTTGLYSTVPMYAMQTDGTIEPWRYLSLLNGWTNRGSGYAGLAFRKVASPPNSIMLVGQVTGGTWTGGTPIAQLPAGYRPANTVSLPVAGVTSSGSTATPTLQITTDGYIRAWYMSGGYAEVCGVVPLDAPTG